MIIFFYSISLIKNIKMPSPSQQHLFSDDVYTGTSAGQ